MRLAVARDDGGLDEDTAQLAFSDPSALEAHQRAAIALADALMTQPRSLTDDAVAELHHHFSREQLVELTVDVMKWNYQKVMVALGSDPEVRPGELTDLVFDDGGHWVRPAS